MAWAFPIHLDLFHLPGHLVCWLPVGTVAFRLNLLSEMLVLTSLSIVLITCRKILLGVPAISLRSARLACVAGCGQSASWRRSLLLPRVEMLPGDTSPLSFLQNQLATFPPAFRSPSRSTSLNRFVFFNSTKGSRRWRSGKKLQYPRRQRSPCRPALSIALRRDYCFREMITLLRFAPVPVADMLLRSFLLRLLPRARTMRLVYLLSLGTSATILFCGFFAGVDV